MYYLCSLAPAHRPRPLSEQTVSLGLVLLCEHWIYSVSESIIQSESEVEVGLTTSQSALGACGECMQLVFSEYTFVVA